MDTKETDLAKRIRAAEELLDDHKLLIAEARANALWFRQAAISMREKLASTVPPVNDTSALARDVRRRYVERDLDVPDIGVDELEVSAVAVLRHYLGQCSHAEEEVVTLQHYINEVHRRLVTMLEDRGTP